MVNLVLSSSMRTSHARRPLHTQCEFEQEKQNKSRDRRSRQDLPLKPPKVSPLELSGNRAPLGRSKTSSSRQREKTKYYYYTYYPL